LHRESGARASERGGEVGQCGFAGLDEGGEVGGEVERGGLRGEGAGGERVRDEEREGEEEG
jgi:hypothetical protein